MLASVGQTRLFFLQSLETRAILHFWKYTLACVCHRIWSVNSAAAQSPVATHGPEALHIAVHQWSSWAFGWCFTSPLLLQESAYESVCMCQGVCTQVIALHILPERIGKWGLTEDRQGKTTGRVPYWNLLYGLPRQKWPLRQPEISFCGSCGLWSCTAATTQFNNAHFEFYLWTKGKVLEQGVWTDQWPVLLDEHRVDKGKKGAKTTPRWLIMLLQRVHLSPIGSAFQAFCVNSLPLSTFLSVKRATFTCRRTKQLESPSQIQMQFELQKCCLNPTINKNRNNRSE